MLFDLRSRGRRRTVQVVYLGLAVLMGGGLVLFGVGAGNGVGGLLNAFTGNGSGSAQTQVVSQQERTALRQVKLNPNSAAAWAQLVQARDIAAKQDFNATTQTVTAAGKREFTLEAQDFQRYLQLTRSPDSTVAILAARANEQIGNYSQAAAAWEYVSLAEASASSPYQCLAVNAYAAKQTRKGDLAAAKALSLAPSLQRATLKQEMLAAKTSPQVAQGC